MGKRIIMEDERKINNNTIAYLYDKLQIDLYRVLQELYDYSWVHFRNTLRNKINEIGKEIEVPKRLIKRISPQLVWWMILHEPFHKDRTTILERYIKLNQFKWKDRCAVSHDTVSNWKFISPGFYITKSVEENQRNGTLINIVGSKQYTVAVWNHLFEPLKNGELLTGYLFLIGNVIYTSPIDLFHISVNETPRVTWEVLLQFHRHKLSSSHSPDPRLYLSLVTTALETIEA